MNQKSNNKIPFDAPITIDEAKSCQDAEWIDAIHAEFKDFDVEDIELTEEEYNNLTTPQRFIRMLKKHIKNEK